MTKIILPWFVAVGFFGSLPPSPEGWPPTDDDDDDDDRATRRDDGAWLTYSSSTVVRPLAGAMCEVEVPPESRVRLLALTALAQLDWTGLGPDDAHHIAYALDGEARRQQRDGGAAYAHRVLEVAGSTYAVNGHPLPVATLAVVQRAAALAAEWPEAPKPRQPLLEDEPALARIFTAPLAGNMRTAAEVEAVDCWRERCARRLPLVDVPLAGRDLPEATVRDVRALAALLQRPESARRRGTSIRVDVPPGDEEVPALVAWGATGDAVEVVQ